MRIAEGGAMILSCWRWVRQNRNSALFLAGLGLMFVPALPAIGLPLLAALRGVDPLAIVSPATSRLFVCGTWISIFVGALVQLVALCRFSNRARSSQQLNPAAQ